MYQEFLQKQIETSNERLQWVLNQYELARVQFYIVPSEFRISSMNAHREEMCKLMQKISVLGRLLRKVEKQVRVEEERERERERRSQ